MGFEYFSGISCLKTPTCVSQNEILTFRTKRTYRICKISGFRDLTSRWVEHDRKKDRFWNLQNQANIFRMLIIASTLMYEKLFLFEKYLTKVPTGNSYFTGEIYIYIYIYLISNKICVISGSRKSLELFLMNRNFGTMTVHEMM